MTLATLDWDDLRYALAVARTGSLSAAARALAVTQPTVGRRIDAFERRLGARLFHRRPSGYTPTVAGQQLVAHAERMQREAEAAERGLGGRDAGLDGVVRVTASEWLAVRVVGPALAELALRHPGLCVELITDPRHLDLARREAELALRPRRFEQPAIHQRRVGSLAFGLYASAAYLARHGAPAFPGCDGHELIAMTDDVGDVARPWLDVAAAGARIVSRTNGREPMAAMAAAGLGLACLPRLVGDATAGLRVLATTPALPSPALWLGVHRDARTIPRVRATATFLTTALQARLR